MYLKLRHLPGPLTHRCHPTACSPRSFTDAGATRHWSEIQKVQKRDDQKKAMQRCQKNAGRRQGVRSGAAAQAETKLAAAQAAIAEFKMLIGMAGSAVAGGGRCLLVMPPGVWHWSEECAPLLLSCLPHRHRWRPSFALG